MGSTRLWEGLAQEILLFSVLAVAIVRFQNQSALALTFLLAIAFVASFVARPI